MSSATFSWTDLVNVTDLVDGNYTVTAYTNDTQGRSNFKSSWFYVDKVDPVLAYVAPTFIVDTNVTDDWIVVNVTAVDDNLDAITIELFNG